MSKLFIFLFVACCGVQISEQSVYDTRSYNDKQDLTIDYRISTYEFASYLYKLIAARSDFNFVFSPLSIWKILAAVAEGADPVIQQKLFQLLRLPNDPFIRQAYYQLASTRLFPSNDVNIKSTRILLIDDGATLSPAWYDYVVNNALLDVVRAPIRHDPGATVNQIQRILSSRLPGLNLSGNSVLLDTLDFNGLWTTAFSEAVIEKAPFYNIHGEAIGAVDIMRLQIRARLAYIKRYRAKIIEFPVGADERFRVLFAVIIGNSDIKEPVYAFDSNTVFDLIAGLKISETPINVAIPRMVISGEIDVRVLLEDMGVYEVWSDPSATKYISNPPALPTSFVQRATLVLNNTGLASPPREPASAYSSKTGLDPILGRDFIADRPFFFGLFYAETATCLMSGIVTQPTYT